MIERERMGVDEEEVTQECKELLITLPKERGWRTPNIYQYQNFWFRANQIQGIISMQKHYIAEDTDIIVSTSPKSGTTWLKALCFAVVNRRRHPHNHPNHPLLSSNPHDLVPFLEKLFSKPEIPDMLSLPRPRLVGTHVPTGVLAGFVGDSKCKIVYMVRNPFDTFVSMWNFYSKSRPISLGPPPSLQEAFDWYCRGAIGFGPFWDHMLGFWHESRRNPNNVMFLRYEEVKEDASFWLKKLADFLGFPFSKEEEEEGMVEGIVKLCSFKQMKELDVNKNGRGAIFDAAFENKNLFRKGEVGDWVNYFTPEMVERLTSIIEQKLAGSGLSFKIN